MDGGGAKSTRETVMRKHDALPPALRIVDCSTTAKWTAGSIEAAWFEARLGMPARTPENVLMRRATDILDRDCGIDTWRHYGPLHPECPPHLRNKTPPKGAWWAQGVRK